MYKVDQCVVCDSEAIDEVYDVDVDQGYPGWSLFLDVDQSLNYKICACRNCGMVFRNLRFSDDDMTILYGSDNSPRNRDCVYENYYDRSKEIASFLKEVNQIFSIKNLKILDVGGGRGELTQYFTNFGCHVDVLEFGGRAEEIERGLHIIETLTSTDYDVVIFSHILEHISRPKDFVAAILRDLNEQAVVYLEVPYELVSYYVLKTKGHYEHLNYFNETSLRNMILDLGGEKLAVKKKIGFGGSIPVIAASFTNRKEHFNANLKSYSSPKLDAVHLRSLYLYVKSKILQRIGRISKSHKI